MYTSLHHSSRNTSLLLLLLQSAKLQDELRIRIEDWTTTQLLGDLFIKFSPYLKMYQIYCNNYEQAVECLNNCMKRKDIESLIEVNIVLKM